MRLVLMGVLVAAMGGAFLLVGLSARATARASAGWPAVPGVVTASGVERRESRVRGGGYNVHYEADVRYRYAALGRDHESNSFVLGTTRSFADSAAARAEVDAYPPGRAVRVFYDPRDASKSVLVPGEAPGGYRLLLWTAGATALVGVALAAAGVRSRRRR